MEDLLMRIVKEASGNKLKELRGICQQAHDFLESQQGQLRAPPHQLRGRCFAALKLALDSKNNKLMSLAIAGLQKLLRDDRFHSQLECESEAEWLPSQLLSTIGLITRHSDEVQVELMKVLLSMACGTWWSMNDVVILRILAMCEEAYACGGSSSIKTACQATASQTVRAFCSHLSEEDRAAKINPYMNSLNGGKANDGGESSSLFDKVLTIFDYLFKELQAKIRSSHVKCGPVYFLLESLLSLISSLPSSAMLSSQLQNYMWKEFCPDLLSLLGSPDKSLHLKSSDGLKQHSHRSTQLFTNEARHLYSICMELVRLAGSISSLRPMLESVFHRILLYTSPPHRLEALRATRELLRSPQLLVDFCGPLVGAEHERKSCGSDLGLLKLAMDAFVECCHCSDVSVCCASVQCVVAMLSSLEHFCDGIGLNDDQISSINRHILNLESADYLGPMTYQRWEKMLKPMSEEVIDNDAVMFEGENPSSISDESKEWDSESSLSTEGPEDKDLEASNELDEDDDEPVDSVHQEKVAKRRERIPKSLVGPYEEFGCGEMYVEQERENAQHFSRVLAQHLVKLLSIRSSIQLDQALQEFASNYCQEVMSEEEGSPYVIIINADGVYLATYTALLLNLKLTRDNFYKTPHEKDPPMNEEEFIEAVHGSGVLVYLSATWLAELYQIILSKDLLTLAGLDLAVDNCSLVSLLDDLEGSSSLLRGAHLISDYSRLARAVSHDQSSPAVEAGKKLARRALTACWSDVVQVLSVLLTGENAVGVGVSLGSALGVESAKEERRRVMDTVAACLDGLQRAARLSNVLCLHRRCESVFFLLVSVSCPSAEPSVKVGGKSLENLFSSAKGRSHRLHSAHVQSIDVILSRGLELGSYSPECWEHVFRCCVYLDELERAQFGRGTSTSTFTTRKVPTAEETLTKGEINDNYRDESVASRELSVSVAEVVKEQADSKGVLPASASLQVLCILSQQADRLFDDAAYKLNLKSLLGFLRVLCYTSREALYSGVDRRVARESGLCLVQRVGDTMLKCARSGRPLIHVMQCWSVVGLHLIEAACHPEQTIAKRAVAGIHDVVNVLLTTQPEMPHFHFNEALFKPFEKLLCLELCDVDIQDQILMSICEYVESCTTEIKSGWRPLFGALKAVRPNPQANYYTCTALDVIQAFLNTENVLVFCNAVVDCIMCLLGHIKGDGESENVESSLCIPCLKYIRITCSHLVEMQKLSSCPSFNSAARVKLDPHTKVVDKDIPSLNYKRFSLDEKSFEAPWRSIEVPQPIAGTLEDLEQPSGVIRVWYLIFGGLISAATQYPCSFHQQKLDTLFDLIRKVFDQPPGAKFALYVVNHMLLPSIQDWLRRTSRLGAEGWVPEVGSRFKQCCGQSAELVVECLTSLSHKEEVEAEEGRTLMLDQLLWLMVECTAQPSENISRLGCSCIRHVIVSAGPALSVRCWEAVMAAVRSCCYVSLFSLRQLMAAFKGRSDNFYGDIGQVRVAARCDCFPGENDRLKRLAEQVFQLDNQLCEEAQKKKKVEYLMDNEDDDDRSYVFLLNPPDNEEKPFKEIVSVQLRSVVIGLVAHQMLLQTIGHLLLQGVTRLVPSLANVLVQTSMNSSCEDGGLTPHRICDCLSESQVQSLLDCLETSFEASTEFDSRPGLKFLVQKVSRMQGGAANLYKQSGASWTIRCIYLLESHLHRLQQVQQQPSGECEEGSWAEQRLRSTLDQMLQVYMTLVERKEEDEDWERMQNQPIFFLVAQPDDFLQDLHRGNKSGLDDQSPEEADCKEAVEEEDDEEEAGAGAEDYEKVYDVASQKDIDWVVNEYKRRKQHCAMPSLKPKENLNKKTPAREETKIPTVLKDQEAQVRVCSEMLLSVFTYMSQLSDHHFHLLLPLVYPFFRSLVGVANESHLRRALVEFLERVASHFGFNYR